MLYLIPTQEAEREQTNKTQKENKQTTAATTTANNKTRKWDHVIKPHSPAPGTHSLGHKAPSPNGFAAPPAGDQAVVSMKPWEIFQI